MDMNIYKAAATVGKDTIEAEYFLIERNASPTDLDWTFWDEITIPFYRVKNWIKKNYLNIRHAFQRMSRGYDDVDTFETYDKFIERYTKILTEYQRGHHGYPGGITNAEWESIIDEMLYHLRYMDEMTVVKELEKDVPDNWLPSYKTICEVLDKHKNAFFELFSKYFYYLWD